MLRFFHRYSTSVFGFIMLAIISISMLFFGTDFGGSRDERYALKIGDTEVSFAQFYSRREQAQDQMRQALGQNYARFAPTLLANLNEQLIDATINETLVDNFARTLDMYAGKEQIEIAKVRALPPGLGEEDVRRLLSRMRLTPELFESQIAGDALEQQIRSLIVDASQASEIEIRGQIKSQETEFSAQVARIDPASYVDAVLAPSEEEIIAYYEENAVHFELPDQVKYRFAVIDPKEHPEVVEIFDEDLELYYTDNLQKYRTPEEVLVRMIRLKFDDKDEVAKAGVRSLAEDLHKRIEDGTDISTLTDQYSDDPDLTKSGGQLGWVKRGSRSNEFDEAAFAQKEGGLADIVVAPPYFEIFVVDDYREAGTQPFEEVKEQIEKEVRQREAPAFVAAVAQDAFDQWTSGKTTLEEIASKDKLEIRDSEKLLGRSEDPTGVRGITREVLEAPGEEKQLIDLGERFALVQIEQYKESTIPPLEEVQEKIVAALKEKAAREKARVMADELFAKVSQEYSPESFTAAVTEAKGTVEDLADFRPAAPPHPIFREQSVRNGLSSIQSPSILGKGPVEQDNGFFVVAVSKITPPTDDKVMELAKERRKQVSGQLAELTLTSLTESLKSATSVDVDASLYNS